MNIKLVIASLFIITLVLGVFGVIIYYTSMSPLRQVAKCTGVSDILDKITYLEYNVTDTNGNLYLILIHNNPQTHSGNATLFINNVKNVTVTYQYDKRLKSITIQYSNGTIINATGPKAALFEEMFYTSMNFQYNTTTGETSLSIFPGIAPVYMICYVGKVENITWSDYAKLARPRNLPIQAMDVLVNVGKIGFKDKSHYATVIRLVRHGEITNKWTVPTYDFVLINYNGIPISSIITVSVSTPTYSSNFVFKIINIETIK